MARSETPWVVGLAPRLEVRRNSDTPGTSVRTWSSCGRTERAAASIWMAENAASPALGGSRAG